MTSVRLTIVLFSLNCVVAGVLYALMAYGL